MGYIFAVIAIVAIFVIIQLQQDKKKKEKLRIERQRLNIELNEIKGFTFTRRLVSKWGLMALDETKKVIAVKSKFGKIKIYPFSAIHSCEILVNGETTYKKSSVIGRSIVGGVIAGGTGALIGGFSGKEKMVKEVSSIEFKILFKDTAETTFKYLFFDSKDITSNTQKYIKEDDKVFGIELKKAKSQLQYWKDKIEVIISVQEEVRPLKESTISVSDELLKLAELKKNELLTQEEFDKIKAKLIDK